MPRIVGLLCLLPVFLAAYISYQIFMDTRPPVQVEIVIPDGASTAQIGKTLYQNKIIRSAYLFRLLAKFNGLSANLQSGHYRFRQKADMQMVMRRIYEGDVILYQLTVPEGLRLDEIIKLLAEKTETDPDIWQRTLSGITKGTEAEGLLLPETYTYQKPVQPKRVLMQMITSQQKILDSLGQVWLDHKQLRIVASIIEKETSLDAERPLVASVIRNRILKRMPLQMDPTVIYGLWRTDGSFSGNLRKKDLSRDTPWNTYTRSGLPVSPISNPGEASLRAAANPADTNYLYFVADGRGGHIFASSLAEHDKNVRRWLKIERTIQKALPQEGI
ncbi:MAG: endolytic transglycosylase MltG [Mariprofundaceae bacterium]